MEAEENNSKILVEGTLNEQDSKPLQDDIPSQTLTDEEFKKLSEPLSFSANLSSTFSFKSPSNRHHLRAQSIGGFDFTSYYDASTLSSFNYDGAIIPSKELVTIKLLGGGCSGNVWLGRYDDEIVAIKIPKHLSKEELKLLQKELDVLNKKRHPNIVSLVGVCLEEDRFWVITEYCSKGSLASLMKKETFSLSQRFLFALGVARGFRWLHSLSPIIIHLDLKLDNIVVDHNYSAKIADFGIAAIKRNQFGVKGELSDIGNLLHQSPEVMDCSFFDEKADVYSFSILLWEIISGIEWDADIPDDPNIPLYEIEETFTKKVITEDFRPRIDNTWHSSLTSLMTKCWGFDAHERPSFHEIVPLLRMAYIDSILQCPVAIEFWKKNFPNFTSLEWENFCTVWFEYYKLPRNEENEKFLFYILNVDVIHQVLFTNFAKFSNGFILNIGDEKGFINFKACVQNDWFHGHMSRHEALEYLKGSKVGTFLVRFSDSEGCFAISCLEEEDRVHHQRVIRQVDENGSYLCLSFSSAYCGLQFQDLSELIQNPKISEELDLKQPFSQDSKFKNIKIHDLYSTGDST